MKSYTHPDKHTTSQAVGNLQTQRRQDTATRDTPRGSAQRRLQESLDNSPRTRRLDAYSQMQRGGAIVQRTRWVAIDEQLQNADNPDEVYMGSSAPLLMEGDTWDDETGEITHFADRMGAIFRGEGNGAPALNLPSAEEFAEKLDQLGKKPAEARVPAIPREAAQIMRRFNEGGLLIKSLQIPHAHKDFQDADVTLEEAQAAARAGRYGSKRNWSLAHGGIKPSYYKMGVSMLPRNMASLADPELIGDERFVEISDTDKASNSRLPADTRTLPPDEARRQMGAVRERLLKKQSESAGRIDNSEIQTVGFSPNAVVGFMFKEGGNLGSWEAARATFQQVVNRITDPGSDLPGFTPSTRERFYVFTYTETDTGTELVYLDTLSPQRA